MDRIESIIDGTVIYIKASLQCEIETPALSSSAVYLSIGEVVAALAILFAFFGFSSVLYRTRFQINLGRLKPIPWALVSAGVIAPFMSAVAANQLVHAGCFPRPIYWEIMGGCARLAIFC